MCRNRVGASMLVAGSTAAGWRHCGLGPCAGLPSLVAKVSDHRSSTIGVILRAWPINKTSTVSTE